MPSRLNQKNGDYAGIVLAHIDVDYLLKYFNSINLGKKGSIAMLADDGTLVLRRPLIAVAALSREEVLEGWRSSAIVQIIGNAVLIIILLIFGGVIGR